jgi:hypothetical protein
MLAKHATNMIAITEYAAVAATKLDDERLLVFVLVIVKGPTAPVAVC